MKRIIHNSTGGTLNGCQVLTEPKKGEYITIHTDTQTREIYIQDIINGRCIWGHGSFKIK